MAIVAGGVLAVALAFGAGLTTRWMTVGAVIVWFAYLTRFEPSVLRAGVMALLLLVARLAGRAGDARYALAVAVLLLLLVDPALAGSLGLTLSAAATAGVLVAAPLVHRRLTWLPTRAAEVTAITLGAQIAVIPVVLASFEQMGVSAVPANVVAVPAAMLAAAISFVASVVAIISVEAAAGLLWFAGWPARFVLATAHLLADRGGVAALDRPASVVAAVATAVWLLVGRGTALARIAAGVGVVALGLACMPVVAGLKGVDEFTVTAIDVGQGDAFLVESPDARILVDAGGDDAAARWLRRHGRRWLDVVVVTHPHLDHIGGVADVVSQLRVGEVWYRPQVTPLPAVTALFEQAQARGVPVIVPPKGMVRQVGDVVIEVLHPPSGRPFRFASSELNDTSTIVRITAADGRRVLLTGDVEREGQRHLLDARIDVSAELFTVPHHGANTSLAEFLAAIDGCVAVVSAGLDNAHGHPHPDIVASLERLGVVLRRTDQESTVSQVVPPRSCRQDGYLAGRGQRGVLQR